MFVERFDFVVVVSALQGYNSSAQRMQAVKCKYSIQQVKVRRSKVFSMHIFFFESSAVEISIIVEISDEVKSANPSENGVSQISYAEG